MSEDLLDDLMNGEPMLLNGERVRFVPSKRSISQMPKPKPKAKKPPTQSSWASRTCKTCGKRFSLKKQLEIHSTTHTKDALDAAAESLKESGTPSLTRQPQPSPTASPDASASASNVSAQLYSQSQHIRDLENILRDLNHRFADDVVTAISILTRNFRA